MRTLSFVFSRFFSDHPIKKVDECLTHFLLEIDAMSGSGLDPGCELSVSYQSDYPFFHTHKYKEHFPSEYQIHSSLWDDKVHNEAKKGETCLL